MNNSKRQFEKSPQGCKLAAHYQFVATKSVVARAISKEILTKRGLKCEDYSDCPYVVKCKKGNGNRTIRMNEELTSIHKEVVDNLTSTHGLLLRANRSIQAEAAFVCVIFKK